MCIVLVTFMTHMNLKGGKATIYFSLFGRKKERECSQIMPNLLSHIDYTSLIV